ncbi:hypothetical protein [Streptomyces coffeae]|uniref:Uncharacterized protein n=1 Tax=Streptomyces coffeae TaxID=621382 RepID=A0ABS1NJL7_9ACTN|nr:hypothetical protein [Streptomyces coffeae]MBL1100209.1 hypothetical protein [Streptomyces coffeae]
MSARRTLSGTFLGLGALLLASAAVAPAAHAAPVPVTALNCDGDTYTCTANLRFGDGRWVAQWSANIFHQARSASARSATAVKTERAVKAPVPVTSLNCDGDTGKCTAALQFGDGRWVAQWSARIFHQAMANAATTSATPTKSAAFTKSAEAVRAPVPVTSLNCDGDTGTCTAGLQFGDGRWVAEWSARIFHQ